ncbi:hypothetical protein QZM30_25235 [Burkholderia orbicola]|nr:MULTISPECIES: hypothetical protein [Burkholderia cepacia complex]MDN7533368.1 hypothetical protein [Burkholderia orbicola]
MSPDCTRFRIAALTSGCLMLTASPLPMSKFFQLTIILDDVWSICVFGPVCVTLPAPAAIAPP